MPGTKKKLGIKVPGENRFLYVGSAILGATIVALFVLGRYQASLKDKITQINNQIVTLDQARDKKSEQDLRNIKYRIDTVEQLLSDHIYWTQAFSVMVNLLQGNVRFKVFSGNTNTDTISILLQATSYTALAKQLASFLTEESIADFSLGKVSPTGGFLEASIEINFDKIRLLQKDKK